MANKLENRKSAGEVSVWITPLLFFGVLFYWPLGKILSIGFSGNWLTTLADHKIISIFWFTVWQAGLSALIALLVGIPGAYVLYHRTFPGQHFLRALITVPFVLPTIVVAVGFTAFRELPVLSAVLGGQSGIPIIICANVFMNYSLAVRIIGGVWSHLDEAPEDAAALDGAGRFRTFISIILPQLRHSITSAGALIFLYCAANFGIVLVLGSASTRTLETEIYITATQFLDLPKTSALVFLQTLLTIIAFLVAQRLSNSKMGFGTETSFAPRKALDRRDLPVTSLTFFIILGLICAPLINVLIRALRFNDELSITNFKNLSGHGARDLLSISVSGATSNTIRNAAIAAFISMSIGLIGSFLLSRPQRNPAARASSRIFEVLFQLPLGISSVVLGFGYLVTFGSGFFPLRSSWLVTPIAQSIIAIPLVIRLVLPSLLSIEREMLETAETDAASVSQIWWQIEVPIIRNTMLIALGYATVISFGEFGAANFLAYGDQGTLPTILFQLISRPGDVNFGMAMAASSVVILFALLVVYLVSVFDRKNR